MKQIITIKIFARLSDDRNYITYYVYTICKSINKMNLLLAIVEIEIIRMFSERTNQLVKMI